jgi:hypothetical protein
LVANEITKMFTNQIYSLKKLTYVYNPKYHLNISFLYVPGTRDLLELCCSSNLPSDFFYQLSQICHNLQSISVLFYSNVSYESNGSKELISSQKYLKNLTLSIYDEYSWASANIIPAIIKHSHTITKLRLYGNYDLPFSFISSFKNLQEFILSLYVGDFKDFRKLQYINFPKLESLKIPHQRPMTEHVIKFLKNNGNNLKKFYLGQSNEALNLSIANFCPKIKSLFVVFTTSEILKNIIISCKYLESINIWSRNNFLNEKKVLDTVVNYSPNNFHELKINNDNKEVDVSPKDLESFFVSWCNRTPKKLLSLIFIDTLFTDKENLKLIEKYKNLGIIKFYTKEYSEHHIEEELDFFY